MLNKFRHHLYNPEFDSVFSKQLYNGLVEEAEKIELNRKYTGSGGSHRSLTINKSQVEVSQPTVSDFIVKNKTYVKALNMANSEAFKKFQDPPRSFPK